MNSTSTVLSIGFFKLQFSVIAEMRDCENTWANPIAFQMEMNLEMKLDVLSVSTKENDEDSVEPWTARGWCVLASSSSV